MDLSSLRAPVAMAAADASTACQLTSPETTGAAATRSTTLALRAYSMINPSGTP